MNVVKVKLVRFGLISQLCAISRWSGVVAKIWPFIGLANKRIPKKEGVQNSREKCQAIAEKVYYNETRNLLIAIIGVGDLLVISLGSIR
jgi:hypothetical protein